MQLKDIPLSATFRDVDGIPVVQLASGECLAFEKGAGGFDESRPYPNHAKATAEGDRLTYFEFVSWLRTGKNRFDVHSS